MLGLIEQQITQKTKKKKNQPCTLKINDVKKTANFVACELHLGHKFSPALRKTQPQLNKKDNKPCTLKINVVKKTAKAISFPLHS